MQHANVGLQSMMLIQSVILIFRFTWNIRVSATLTFSRKHKHIFAKIFSRIHVGMAMLLMKTIFEIYNRDFQQAIPRW